jgi:hypothetical protein
MSSVLRSIVILSFASLAALLSAPGCSQQGEGERCDSAKNGDDDCDSGLTCVSANELLSPETDRCCPADGQESDSRCTRGAPTSSGGSSNSGTAGAGDAGDGTGTTNAGAPTSSGGTTAMGGTTATSGTGAGAVAGADVGGSPGAAGAGQGGAG